MKEKLAAAVLAVAGWPAIAAAGGGFVDPMCGSGTLPIEAAMIAGDIAPGPAAPELGLLALARPRRRGVGAPRRRGGRPAEKPGSATSRSIAGSDADARAVEIARACVRARGARGRGRDRAARARRPRAAGVDAADARRARRRQPALRRAHRGARRTRRALPRALRAAARRLRRLDAGGHHPRRGTRARGSASSPRRPLPLYNGRILTQVSVFRVPGCRRSRAPAPAAQARVARRRSATRRRGVREPPAQELPAPREVGAPNRRDLLPGLRRRPAGLRRRGRHLHGAGPDAGTRWAHIAEYAPPAEIDPVRARSSGSTTCCASCRRFSASNRPTSSSRSGERQRGDFAVRAAVSRSGVIGIVAEGGLLFEVNLTDYLDTGLFLDHRLTRGMDARAGRRASASSTCSPTPAPSASTPPPGARARRRRWTSRRPTSSGPGATWPATASGGRAPAGPGRRAAVARRRPRDSRGALRPDLLRSAHVLELQAHAGAPGTCSATTSSLITRTAQLLAPGGTLVFSCNRRKFALDVDGARARGAECEDITARTIPQDFERTPGVHSCWLIRRARRS